MPRGRLIAIEGIDAVGKRTQSLLLRSSLMKRGVEAELLEFPDYATPIGKEIGAFLSGRRDYPIEVRHMLFAANRWEHSRELKAVERGKNIIVNRYSESNLVYGVANGLELDWLLNLEKGLPQTDMVILLDAPPAHVSPRRATKDENERNLELQEGARKIYRRFARRFGWTVIPATGTVEQIGTSILRTTLRELF